MSAVEKISIALTHDMAALVRQAVESGDYASSSEVVREALRAWKTQRELEAQRIETLRGLWREGIESGPGRFAGMDDLLAEARRRFEAQG